MDTPEFSRVDERGLPSYSPHDEVVSDDAHHRRWQKVRKILAEQGKKNQLTTRSMLLRGTKWPSKELDNVLQTMDQAGILEVRHQPGSNGKMSTYYKLKG